MLADGRDDDDERMAAINALLQMNAENAVPILKQVLAKRDACSEGLREKAVFLLSQKRTSETEDILLGVMKNDPSREVRKKAVFWLGQVNTDKAAAALEQIMSSSTADDEMREQAVFALMQQHSARGQAAVRAIAQDPKAPDGVREKAVFWLGQQKSPENAAFLRGMFDKLASAPEGSSAESLRAEDPLLAVADARRGQRQVADGGRGQSQALGRDAQEGDLRRGAGGRDDSRPGRALPEAHRPRAQGAAHLGAVREARSPRPSIG